MNLSINRIGPTENRSGMQYHAQYSLRSTGMANIRTRPILAILLVFAILLPLGAIGQAEYAPLGQNVVSIVDSRGVTVSLPRYPDRIISLSPNITETLFALGIGERLVGRTDYCDYPSETQHIESMGDLFTPSIEKIVSAAPDLVIISNLGQSQTIDAIETAGIPVAFIDEPGTMEGTFRIIEQVGEITGTEARAREIVLALQQTLETVAAKRSPGALPTVYYVAGFGEWGDFTATGDTFIHDIIVSAGAVNIAEHAVNWSYQLELILANDPDIIILPPMWGSTFEQTKKEFVNHPSYSSLTAVKRDRIITIDSNLMERQGPRSAEAVQQLAQKIVDILR